MLNLLHLPVGMSSPVRGRVDASAARMKATFDINMRILSITSDAKPGWRIDISVPDSGAMEPVFMLNTMNVHPIEHSYDKNTGVFRADSQEELCFWLEVDKAVWQSTHGASTDALGDPGKKKPKKHKRDLPSASKRKAKKQQRLIGGCEGILLGR